MAEPRPTRLHQDARLLRLERLLDHGAVQQAARMVNTLQPGEIAHLLESRPVPERLVLWDLVGAEHDGEVLLLVNEEVRAELLGHMDPHEVLAMSADLELDDLADLVQELPAALTQEILDSLDSQRRTRLEAVLSYAEDTAGGLMDPDVITIRPEVTLDVALRYMRMLREKVPRQMDSLIVINREGRYLGVLSLADLITHPPEDTVAEVMSLDVEPIPAHMSETDVAARFERHDLLSAPVVDDQGRLLGRITVDDVVDVIREQGEHAFMGPAGLSEDEDMFAPVLASARRRALWLGINLLTAILAAWVIGLFEHAIERVVALAVLMPIVASMGGVAGTQTLTLTVRGIALGQLTGGNARALILKELAVGTINSLIWAVVMGGIAVLWFDNHGIGLLIGVALTINLVSAAVAGALVPLGLKRIGIDPALAGGVLLTTVTDIVGFMAFLGLATLYLI